MHKGGESDNCHSFRPASLTNIVLETLEGVLRDRIVNHLAANNLMMVEQHSIWRKLFFLNNFMSFLNNVNGGIDGGE